MAAAACSGRARRRSGALVLLVLACCAAACLAHPAAAATASRALQQASNSSSATSATTASSGSSSSSGSTSSTAAAAPSSGVATSPTPTTTTTTSSSSGDQAGAAAAAPAPAPDAPEKRLGPKPEPKKVKIVEAAPEAEVQNDDDVDPQGACADTFAGSSCREVDVGEGRLAECISQLMAAAEVDEPGSNEGVNIPEACEIEVYNYYIERSKNINANVPLARACKADAEKLCTNTPQYGPKDGRIIACLKDARAVVSPGCRSELYKQLTATARDYRADPSLKEACADDAVAYCAAVKPGGGRVQACLRENHMKLNWECAEQLFRAELEGDDDIRLSVRLYGRCLSDKRRFCGDVEPGHSAAKDCLIAHRNDNGFSGKCREELEVMIERRVRDFRLDSRLRKHCASDIVSVCGMVEDLAGDESGITTCLQDYVAEITDEKCRTLVKQYQALAAQDVRFNVPLADACHDDRTKLCSGVPPGSARVIRCLESNRLQLSSTCRATLFDEEVRFSENIDFQFPMKKACVKEIRIFCPNVPHGNGRVIRCLQENKGKKDFGKPCLGEVISYEQQASSDYRLNHRLRVMCRPDIEATCKDVCPESKASGTDQLCGGTVLRCLTDRFDALKVEACKKEVRYYMRMKVEDYRNDLILAANCRGDVETLCKDVQPDEQGGVHACLRRNRDKLSDACRREELLLEAQQAEHIELRPGLLAACATERGMFCRDVKGGSGRVFRCLADHLADPDLGPLCRGQVISKIQRRQANWRLDPPLRKACRADVDAKCKAEDELAAETGLVYRCLIAQAETLQPGCRKELGRAVHMALFVWIPGSIITQPCDVDIASMCLKDRPNMLHDTGTVAKCLADTVQTLSNFESAPAAAGAAPPPALSAECRAIASVAEAQDAKAAFDASLSAAALLGGQLARLEAVTGAPMLARDSAGRPEGVTLTGWSALLGIAALLAAVVVGGAFAWRQYRGGADPATVVLKSRPGYGRVSTSAS
ncbi:hypothetical protein Rsub_12450 [Raphidocelis subcapitata]|uniref:Uncharacterized protein n=1 Tax=Raphidocelis subcapitata TaxID=307507 RepID=A0A2V0PQF5_9CHLO|nr:hypothetical protein Rsub_12450 [Raphidocelis subcapitata]|eukprot:GBF99737.1 hypothetical protein Rsub_12450 [Raphidocelis subcapitata]